MLLRVLKYALIGIVGLVFVVYAVLAGLLWWGDRQTAPPEFRQEPVYVRSQQPHKFELINDGLMSLQPPKDSEVESLGIVGGTSMNSASLLVKYMRAVRPRFQMNGNSGNLTNGGDRFCAGVLVGANTIVTASHCAELLNNAG